MQSARAGGVAVRLALILALAIAGCAARSPADPRVAIVSGTGRGGDAIRSLLLNAAVEGQRRGYGYFVVLDPAGAASRRGTPRRNRLAVRFLSDEEASGGGAEIWNVAEILAAAAAAPD